MTTEHPVRELQKSYGTKSMALSIGIGLVFLILGYKAVCRGLVLGGLFSTINFVLMAQTVQTTIRNERTKASLWALTNILFRYVLMAIPLFIAIKFSRFDLVATVIGLFTVQVVILSDQAYHRFPFLLRKRKKA